MQKYRSQACLLDNLVETFFKVRRFSIYIHYDELDYQKDLLLVLNIVENSLTFRIQCAGLVCKSLHKHYSAVYELYLSLLVTQK